MRILGLDPGISGAYALIDDHDLIVEPFPLAGKQLDLAELYREWRTLDPEIAVIESVHAMPKQGSVSTFTFGRGLGQIEGVLAALEIRREYVTPQAWKKLVLAGTAKDKPAAVEYATRAFPAARLVQPGCRKPHDGMADAICLAEYGRRTFVGDR